jgi:hypothetical protein
MPRGITLVLTARQADALWNAIQRALLEMHAECFSDAEQSTDYCKEIARDALLLCRIVDKMRDG